MPSLDVPLARNNLLSNPVRLVASTAGIAFAVSLMFTQNGFRSALMDSMAAVIIHLDGDLMIISRSQYSQFVPQPFPRRRLEQAKGLPQVKAAIPLYVECRLVRWKNPLTGLGQRIRVIGYPPEERVFTIPEIAEQKDLWMQPDTALADLLSQHDKYGDLSTGAISELGGRRTEIVGQFALGVDFQNHGNVIVSEENFLTLLPHRQGASWGSHAIDVGVIRLEESADVASVQQELQNLLPEDVLVLTKQQYIEREQGFWARVTPIGTVFTIGVVMGFIVGLAVCYQVLFTEISDHLDQFATLKAMGHSDQSLARIIVSEGVYLSVFGYGMGLIVSLLLFSIIHEATGLPLELKVPEAIMIFVLSVVMCVASGLIAARRLRRVDAASLFS